VLGQVSVDCGLEIDDRVEAAAADAPTGQAGEEVLYRVQPRCRDWGKVERPSRMPLQPSLHLGMLMCGVVVDDGFDRLVGGHLAINGVEEADELLMPVPLHAAPDHLAFQHAQCGEQRGGAMALVVVRHRPAAAGLQRQAGWVRSSAWIWLFSSIADDCGHRRSLPAAGGQKR
jgi:hypothetical protein